MRVVSDAMTVFAEALARGVQRHGAVLVLYTLRPTTYMQSVSVASSRMCHRSLRSAAGPGVGSRWSSVDGAFVHANSTSTLDQEPVWWDEDKASHDADSQCTSRKLEDCNRISKIRT